MASINFDKLEQIKNDIIKYLYNARDGKELITNEEQTKNWLILPLLEALGYNIHSSDVTPEVTADFSKKGEKVDYVLQVNNEMIAIIECKKFMEPLSDHINQLYRYFPTLGVHIGILTNGVDYWFFTDRKKENVMDKEAFLKINISVDDLKLLADYCKENIKNAPVPSIERKRKVEDEEKKQLIQQKEQELAEKKAQIGSLRTQIDDLQALIEKSKSNEVVVKQMEQAMQTLKNQLDAANENIVALEIENDNLKASKNDIDEEAYNAMLVQQMLTNESIKSENKQLKAELKEVKKNKKEKKFYGDSALDKQKVPENIARDMVALFPSSLFVPSAKFFDPYCRYGELLNAVRERAMQEPAMRQFISDEDDLYDYISDNMLYGFVIDQMALKNVTRVIHGTSNPKESHIVCFGDEQKYIDSMKSDSKIFVFDKLKELGQMKFDAVIGNPPYNNDLYIPFVELGHSLAKECSVFITPAKWQAKGGEKNEQFRKEIVPYMNKIVMYKDSTEIFDIEEWGGISYYILNNESIRAKAVKNVCRRNNTLASDFETHDESEVTLYNRNILQIIGKAGQLGEGFKQSLYVKNTDHGEKSIAGQLGFKRCVFVGEQERGEALKQAGYVEVMQGEKVVGYKPIKELYTQVNIDKYKCICSIMPGAVSAFDSNNKVLGMFKISIIGPYQVPKGSFPVLKYFNTEDECKSFISYMNTRLISFLYYMGCCGTTLTKEFFRFIPDPKIYDHIFTNEELYKKYNLTQEEINIIESVIKERK